MRREIMKAKKLLSMVLASVMTLTMAVTAVTADDSITVLLDSMELTFDVPPMIVEGRTLVPFRGIFEALGYEVDWDEASQTVMGEKGDLELKMVIGKTEATVQNNAEGASEPVKNVTFEVPPQIVDGRTLVPVRAVAEMSGYKVDWIDDTRTVTIVTPVEILTGPGPAMPETTTNPSAQTTPEPAAPEATTNPSAQATPEPVELPIAYDDTNERESHSVRYFELLSAEKNASGDYEITFTFKTFMEGSGDVSAAFNCLDATGKVIGTFGGSYRGKDYSWAPHEDKATIPGATVKIELAL